MWLRRNHTNCLYQPYYKKKYYTRNLIFEFTYNFVFVSQGISKKLINKYEPFYLAMMHNIITNHKLRVNNIVEIIN